MLEPVFSPDRAADELIAILSRAEDQPPLPVQVRFTLSPKSIAPLPITEDLPLGRINGFAIELICPCEMPPLTGG